MSGRTLVAGASGAVGMRICELLAEEGTPLRALVRSSTRPEAVARLRRLGAELVVGDLEAPASLEPAVAGVEAVATTASGFPADERPDGIDRLERAGSINLVEAAAAAGVGRFLYTSFREIDPDFPFQQAKRSVEERLAASGMAFTVLRPGSFMQVWFSPMLGFDLAGGSVRVYGDGEARTSWISSDDVARVAVWALRTPEAVDATLDFGGPEALSYEEVIAVFEEHTRRPLSRSYVPLAELEQLYAGARDARERSLAGVMLSVAKGGAIVPDARIAASGIELTSVRAFVEATSAAGQ